MEMVDVSVSVDTTALQDRLAEIESKLDQDQTIEDKVSEALENADLGNDSTVKDLERRLDRYAQKVDRLEGAEAGDFCVNEDFNKLTARVDELQSINAAMVGQIAVLTQKMEALSNQTQDAITFFGLIRRAAEIILGR
jgi:uncharacterized coiled-coil protein SlyX